MPPASTAAGSWYWSGGTIWNIRCCDPTDVVIESNIDRTGAAATAPAPVREPKASPEAGIARHPMDELNTYVQASGQLLLPL
jgi:hypothetical protein